MTRSNVVDLVNSTSGSEGVYYMVDRETGRAMAVTLWDSKESLLASEREAARIREQSTSAIGGTITGVEHYEVVLQPSDMMANAT
jgi:hypothetical protein